MALLAEGILKLHWDQTVPVNVAHIVKAMGVRLLLEPDLAPCALLSISASNQAQIRLSQSLAHLHQRYVVAHALGHVALHHLRPGMEREIDISADFRLDFSQRHMAEANDFALRLLMPEAALHYAVNTMQARDAQEVAHVFAVDALFVKQRMAELGLAFARPVPMHQRGFTIDLE
ncbi:MAG: ImmA/IrrE family metallo-endopeptidase [Comamonas sp.]|nr:ImmA/IrrE family metallo-endopeptidase [Candidatus Comamonas equi]